MCEHGWVVCAPGDPNHLQHETIIAMSGPFHFCMTQWNADTEEVRFTIYGDNVTEHVITPSGATRELETTDA